MKLFVRRLLLGSFAVLLLASGLVALVPSPQKASAATTQSDIKNAKLEWVNRVKVKATIGSETFYFKRPHATTNTGDSYKIENRSECGGDDKLDIKAGSNTVDDSENVAGHKPPFVGDLKMKYVDPASSTGACVNEVEQKNISIANTGNGDIFFGLVDDSTIQRVDGATDWEFKKDPSGNFTRTSETGKSCIDRIIVKGSDMWLYELTDGGPDKFSQNIGLGSEKCRAVDNASHVHLLTDYKYQLADYRTSNGSNTNGNPISGQNSSANPSPSLKCEVSIINPLTWLFCPIVAAANEVINVLDAQIVKELNVDANKYFGDINDPLSTGSQFYEVWSNFRTIGLVLLVLAALVMVISQAIAVGPFDAYTVKKVMPRILIAIIMITLSWDASKFLITMSNDAGLAVRYIIQGPFSGIGAATIGGKTASAGALIAGAAGLALGIVGLLSFAVTGLLAVLIAFLVLTLRKMAILFLVLVAPFAIACYILPSTQKVWKFWWETFSKALLMFPIVMGFIAIGRVFAAVTSEADKNSGSLLAQIVVMIAYFGPYFALPTAFKLAGGAVANIAGIANDRSRGAFDRLKKYRQGKTSENVHKMATGDRFQGRNALTRQFNRRTSGAAGGWRGAHFGFGARGEAYHDIHGREAAEEAIKNNALLRQLAYDDNGIAVMALSGGTEAGARRAALQLQRANGWTDTQRENAVQSASAVGFNNSNGLGAMTLLAQNKSRALAGTLGGEAGMQLLRESATNLAGGNEQMTDNVMGNFAFHSRNAGRLDFGDGRVGQTVMQGWQRATTAQHAQSYGASLQHYTDRIPAGLQAAAANDRSASAIALMEMQNMLPGATAENQRHINAALSRAGVDHNLQVNVPYMQPDGTMATQTRHVSVEEQLATLSGGAITASEIRGRARVYDSSVPIDQRNPQQPQPTPGTTP